MQNQYLEDLLHEVSLITKKVQAEFGRLSVEQLNWKPSADQWSIAQCLDHLIQSNRQYFPLLEGVANGTRKSSFWEKLPGLPGFIGKMMLKALDPSNQKKRKSPASFRPSASQLPASIVADFVEHQQQLIQLIKATDHVDHQKTIVSSPVSGLITFSLKDGVSIMVVHEERHFMQAKRLLQVPGFPQTTDPAVPLAAPTRPNQQDRPNRPPRPDRAGGSDQPGGSDRPPRPDRQNRSDRSPRPDRAGGSDQPGGSDRPPRPDRQNRSNRPPRPDRAGGSDQPGGSNRPPRPDRPGRSNRPPRPDRTSGPDLPDHQNRPSSSDRPKRPPRPPRPNRSDRPTPQSQ